MPGMHEYEQTGMSHLGSHYSFLICNVFIFKIIWQNARFAAVAMAGPLGATCPAHGLVLIAVGSLLQPQPAAGMGTCGLPRRWMQAQLSHSSSLVLALERLSHPSPVNYVPFLKKVD